jgi:3-hydroxyisobutyrate dehydrogenase-like beta-hydroxyacid dehydrogenase
MAKIGFLGLGIMGWPMAQNLIKAGHDVAVWSHTEGKARRFAESLRATACRTPAEAAQGATCTFLCVGDTTMSEKVILGESGLINGASQGLTIVDCSTVSPMESCRIAKKLAEGQIDFLGAPCTGSKAGAEAGTLTFMIGGNKNVFDRTRPYFEAMGRAFYYCGGHGAGLRAKLTQNLILGNLTQAFNEGLVLKHQGRH